MANSEIESSAKVVKVLGIGRDFVVMRTDSDIRVYKISNLELITTFITTPQDHFFVTNDLLVMLCYKHDFMGQLLHPG